MQGLIITNKGMEYIAALEVKELLKAKAEQDDFIVKFPIKKEKDLVLLKKKSRAASRILYLFGEVKVSKNIDSSVKNFIKVLKSGYMDKFLKNKIYRVDCQREGKHEFKSVDISKKIAEFLIKQGYKKVTFKNPEVSLYIFIDNKKGYIGIDVSGDISKRDYKIFNNARSLKGNIAYALVRESGYEKGKTLIDPFCLSGEIVIEAALFSKGKIYGYDVKRNIIAAKKNSKIANVDEIINFGEYDLSWLDTRHKSIDVVAARLPELSKHKKEKSIERLYKDFFEKSFKILKKKGRIVIISKDHDIIKNTKGKLKILKELTIFSGKMPLEITLLEK